MKKLSTLIAGALLFAIATANAQTTNSDNWMKKDFAGAGLIQVTYRSTDLGQLNSVLAANGLNTLGHNDVWLNLSMDHVHNKWIFEDGIGFTPLTTSETNGIKAKYNQYNVFARFGYDVSKNERFRLFPFAGLNFNMARFEIEDKTGIGRTSDFGDEILNQTASKTFYQPNLGIDLGAGFDYLIPVKAKQMDNVTIERNIPIGIRLGYYINVSQGDWKINDHSLNNAPNDKNSAFFVSAHIGLGYKIHRR